MAAYQLHRPGFLGCFFEETPWNGDPSERGESRLSQPIATPESRNSNVRFATSRSQKAMKFYLDPPRGVQWTTPLPHTTYRLPLGTPWRVLVEHIFTASVQKGQLTSIHPHTLGSSPVAVLQELHKPFTHR